jgi:hypothetical protein
MTDAVLVGLIAAIPSTVAALAALVVSLKGNRKVDAVALSVNGRLTQLLGAVGQTQRAEGRADGIEQERSRP